MRILINCASFWIAINLVGCSPSAPTQAWLAFHGDAVKKHENREGAWGGSSYVQWEAAGDKTFEVAAIKQFAASNQWTFISEQSCAAGEMNLWKGSNGKDIFPLGFDGFAPSTHTIDETYNYFPRAITQDCAVLKFDTHWLIALGGIERPAYGYALVAHDGRKMALYHLWGE